MHTPVLPCSENEEEDNELEEEGNLNQARLDISFRDHSGGRAERKKTKEVKTPERRSDWGSEQESRGGLSPEVVTLLLQEGRQLREQLSFQANQNSEQLLILQQIMGAQVRLYAESREAWEQERRRMVLEAQYKEEAKAAAAVAAEAEAAGDWGEEDAEWEEAEHVPPFAQLHVPSSFLGHEPEPTTTPPNTPRTRDFLWREYQTRCKEATRTTTVVPAAVVAGTQGDSKIESVRAVELPKICSPCEADAGLKCGNWLTRTELAVKGFSDSAGPWWARTVSRAMEAYRHWSQANPLEQLKLVPTAEADPEYKLTVLVARVSTCLLEALPKQIADNMIAAKITDPVGILFKILKIYQPGGVQERTTILKKLTDTEPAVNSAAAVAALELWTARRDRAAEMLLTVPDPSVQLCAVLNIVSKVIGGQGDEMRQLAFRTMTLRNQLKVDVMEGEKPRKEKMAAEKANKARMEERAKTAEKARRGRTEEQPAAEAKAHASSTSAPTAVATAPNATTSTTPRALTQTAAATAEVRATGAMSAASLSTTQQRLWPPRAKRPRPLRAKLQPARADRMSRTAKAKERRARMVSQEKPKSRLWPQTRRLPLYLKPPLQPSIRRASG